MNTKPTPEIHTAPQFLISDLDYNSSDILAAQHGACKVKTGGHHDVLRGKTECVWCGLDRVTLPARCPAFPCALEPGHAGDHLRSTRAASPSWQPSPSGQEARVRARDMLNRAETPITDSDLFDAAFVQVKGSGQSDSLYVTVALRAKNYEVARHLHRGKFGEGIDAEMHSRNAADFEENRDDFTDAVGVEMRISDHPSTDSARSEPALDLRIGNPKHPAQRQDRRGFGRPDSPNAWFSRWEDAARSVVGLAREAVGDKKTAAPLRHCPDCAQWKKAMDDAEDSLGAIED